MAFTIQFQGSLANTPISLITADCSGLTAPATSITVNETQSGSSDTPETLATNVITLGSNLISGDLTLTHPNILSDASLNIPINSVTPDLENYIVGVSDQAGSNQVYTLTLGGVPTTGELNLYYNVYYGFHINFDGTSVNFNGVIQSSIQAAFDYLYNNEYGGGPWTVTGSPTDGTTIVFTGPQASAGSSPWNIGTDGWDVSVSDNWVDGVAPITGNPAAHSLALPGAFGGTFSVNSGGLLSWNVDQETLVVYWNNQVQAITALSGSGVEGDPWLFTYNGNEPVSLPTINGSKLVGFGSSSYTTNSAWLQNALETTAYFTVTGDNASPYTFTSTSNGSGQTAITVSANEQATISATSIASFVSGSVSYSTLQTTPNQIDQIQITASAGNFSVSDGSGHTASGLSFDISGTNFVIALENANFSDNLSGVNDYGITDGVHTMQIVFISTPANPWSATADTGGTTTTLTATQALFHISITAITGNWNYTDTNGTISENAFSYDDGTLLTRFQTQTSYLVDVDTYSTSGNTRNIALYYNGDPGSVSVNGAGLIDGLIAYATYSQPFRITEGVIGVTAAYPTWVLTLSSVPGANYLVLQYNGGPEINIWHDGSTGGFGGTVQSELDTYASGWTVAYAGGFGGSSSGGPITITFTYSTATTLGSNPWSIEYQYWYDVGVNVTPTWTDGSAGVTAVAESQAWVTNVSNGAIGGTFSLTGASSTASGLAYNISMEDMAVAWATATGVAPAFATNYGINGYKFVYDDSEGPIAVPTIASTPDNPLITNGTISNDFTDGTTIVGQDDIQTIALDSAVSGGSWSISLSGNTVSPLDYNISASDLQAALRAEWAIDTIIVTGSSPNYTLDFGTHAPSPGTVTCDGASLTQTPVLNIIRIQPGQN